LTAGRGEATAETVVLIPVLVLLVMVCVHVAAWHHAATVATSVAARVAWAEAHYGAVPGEGERRAVELADDLDATLAAPVRVHRSASTVRAEVAIAIPALVPGFPSTVWRQATAARERVVPPGQR